MKRFNPSEVEPRWQKIWADDKRYEAQDSFDKLKYYVTGMFPYPSGAGMHTGHFFEHSIVDVVARFRRAQGYNVMYPMGWDSFGLPAENYAIKTGKAPALTTKENIASFKNQLQRVGASIDWSREINTTDPEYYRWTQWIFTKLFERGLAYQKESSQWWCPVDKTVLANEQVENGKCWRCGNEVEKKMMKQWFFKLTEYADALLEEIPALDWPEKIKTAQTNWIGRSEGMSIKFKLEGLNVENEQLEVFTTAHDTIYGVTFMVVAPEHPIVASYAQFADNQLEIEEYVQKAARKSELDREIEKKKTGVPIEGLFAVNPVNGERIPVWVADYVLITYGTGAIMAVPGEDERDYEFATKYNIPVIYTTEQQGFVNYGDIKANRKKYILANSAEFDGLNFEEGRQKLSEKIKQADAGDTITQYKVRDWLISRQRYWGAPIPIVHCEDHGAVAVSDDQLPVLLPEVEDYEPKGDGKSPLARQEEWVKTTCPQCGKPAKRETDVMDGYACSSWYLLRYTDPNDSEQAWASDLAKYWTPVDMYIGGDHAVAHLLYVRFWSHVFYDMKLVPAKEPVKKLVYHGLIQAEDGRKMSKSLGNVVDPLEVIDAGYGADALRTFELFLGPINENSNWSSAGIGGVHRFLNRFWTLVQEYIDSTEKNSGNIQKLENITHKTIKKVTNDMNRLSFNTAIAAMMECVNELYKLKTDGFSDEWKPNLEALIQLLQPFAPHMSAELWKQLGNDSQLDFVPWPKWSEEKIITSSMKIAVQVNGKLRTVLELPAGSSKDEIEEAALQDEKVSAQIADKTPTKIIYVPGRLVNILS